jgi:hypothetical protein
MFMALVSVDNDKDSVFLNGFANGEKCFSHCRNTSFVIQPVSWVIPKVSRGVLSESSFF